MKKMIIVFMGSLCLTLSAIAQQTPLNITITVNYNGTTLLDVLTDIQKRYGIEFSYSTNDVFLQQRVTFKASAQNARTVVTGILAPLSIEFYEVGNTVVLKYRKAPINKRQAVNGKVTLSGFVREKGTMEALPGATVFIPLLKTGAVCNNYGFYSLTVPPGDYQVAFSSVGFNTHSQTIQLKQSTEYDALISQSNQLEEVVISSYKEVPVSQDVRMSTIDIPVSTVKRMPALGGEKDIFKVLQMYPGVQRGVEGTSGFYVRGGSTDQNLVILDDAPIYNASHAFGLFSIFNGDAIKSAELIKGGFPARYGERLSSILVMNMKDGNKEKLSGEVGVGIISSRFTLEGPIRKGKSSFLLSGRRTYGDIFVQPFLQKGTSTGYYFYDLNAKINTQINKKNQLYLSAYLGNDYLYDGSRGSGYESRNRFGWGNQSITARWNHVFNNKMFGNASVIYSKYQLKTISSDKYEEEESSSSYRSKISDLGFKYDIDYSPGNRHTLRSGVRAVLHRFSPSIIRNTGNREYQNSSRGESNDSWENNLYVEEHWTLSEKISLNSGLRASSFSTKGTTYFNLEPRINTRVMLNNTLSFKASYSRMNQYLNLLSNTNAGLPTDLWIPATKKIAPQRSDQIALGIAKDINEQQYAITLEGYYKKMKNLVSYKEGASFIYLEIVDDLDIPDKINWEDNVTIGRGRSYGAEILAEKKKGRLTGWAGYTLSWTTFQFKDINKGEAYRPPHDRRHNITIAGVYDIRKDIKFSFSWTYMSRSPITIVQSSYTAVSIGPTSQTDYTFSRSLSLTSDMTEYSKKGNYMTDAYHRLDLGIQFIKQKKRGIRTWDISIYNAYNHFNPFYYANEQTFNEDFTKTTSRLLKYAYAPIIPSITYSFKF